MQTKPSAKKSLRLAGADRRPGVAKGCWLEDYSKTKGIKLRTSTFYKEFIQIIVKEEISRAIAQLKAHSIAEIIQIKIVCVFVFLPTTIVVNQFRVTGNAICYVWTKTDPEGVIVSIPHPCLSAMTAEIQDGNQGCMDVGSRKFAFLEINISCILDKLDPDVIFGNYDIILLKFEIIPAESEPPFDK